MLDESKTNVRCVVCQGIIIERVSSTEKCTRVASTADPVYGSVLCWEDKETHYYCSACGIAYYKLPNGQK